MKIVRTFATSANLGPGFDTLGICFDIYNEYSYEVSNEFSLEGFNDGYSDPNDNLIITSYKEVFNVLQKDITPIRLTEIIQHIPLSRGLGSSASCIVAGVLIANDILGNVLSTDEIFQIASKIEGHPDNVAPLIFGGMTCSFKNDKYITIKLNVNNNLKFMVCIPPFELSTEKARSVLPKEVKMSDAVSNISHSIALTKAIELGDVDLLIESSIDKLHQEYRFPLIKDSSWFIEYAMKNNSSCMISGAGPTILLISNKILNISFKNWIIREVKINNQGAYVYEK